MVRAFVLGVILLATIGVCTVMETSKQTQARYQLNELTRREDEAKRRLARLHTEEQGLRSPARLARLVREQRLDLVSLITAMPNVASQPSGRRPGQTLDEQTMDANLASAGNW